MKKSKYLYIVPMFGLGITKSKTEIYGVYVEVVNYQFTFFQYSVWKYCKLIEK